MSIEESYSAQSRSKINQKKSSNMQLKNTNFNWLLFLIVLSWLTLATGYLENYDFIIVGGGTAGLVVARRLAEDGHFKVLVLESGGWPKEAMEVPAFAPTFFGDPDVTYQFQTLPQSNAGQRNPDGVYGLAAGRVLGGTSNINWMWFNRGNPRDYNNWGNITLDNSWNYSNMLKYFKRVETYAGDFPSDQHGFEGAITVSRPTFAPGLQQWVDAGRNLGFQLADPNGPQRKSFTPIEFAKKRGRRQSSYKGYIEPVYAYLPNLRIILNTNVTQIVFRGNRAIGVRFQTNATELKGLSEKILYANKEIIVSAGTYGSPPLLQRSGIGPRDVLQAANIPIIKELPVGQNFQDHVNVPLHIVIGNKNLVMDEEKDLNPDSWEFYQKSGDGPYSSTQGFSGQAFIVSTVAKAEGENDWPDVQLAMGSSVQAFYSTGIFENVTLAPWEAPMLAYNLLMRPKSRGSVRLDPNDPYGLPLIDVGYLTDPRDVEKLLDGIKEIIRIFEQTSTYKKLHARFPPVDIPSCKFAWRTDNFWRCYIRYISGSGCHPTSTCTMGSPSDPKAVVDTELKVIGMESLRVVDASVFPVITNSNTHAAVYGIAEKAAEMIISDWQNVTGVCAYK